MKHNSSNYTEADSTKDWTQSILGIYTMEFKTTMLIAWIGGGAVRVMESLSDEKIMSDIVEVMNRYLSKEYPNLPAPEEIMVWPLNNRFDNL